MSNSSDPTRTLTLRNAFEKVMRQKFTSLTKDVVYAIVVDDCFGLTGNSSPTIFSTNLKISEVRSSPGKKAFAFSRNDAKIELFLQWLKNLEKQKILTIQILPQLGEAISPRWTDVFIRKAYVQGLTRATQEMRKIGIDVPPVTTDRAFEIIQEPIHADRVALIYTRTYNELVGITENMNNQISQILAQGMIEGKGARDLADAIADVLIGRKKGKASNVIGRFVNARRRAVLIARTEIIRAHHLAMIQQYRNWEILNIKVQAEWTTAGDDRVCPLCEALDGQIFTLDEIENMIPVHPGCRCIALPWSEEIAKIEKGVD